MVGRRYLGEPERTRVMVLGLTALGTCLRRGFREVAPRNGRGVLGEGERTLPMVSPSVRALWRLREPLMGEISTALPFKATVDMTLSPTHSPRKDYRFLSYSFGTAPWP